MNEIPELITRKPTGKPPWPMILLSGGEKSGKSWSAAEFSASEMIGRTFYCEIGEHYADEYGAIPGARYEILQHDGSFRGIGTELWKATRQPRVDGKPNCIIADSVTILWDMLSERAQRVANARWRKNNPGKPEPEDEVTITVDLWNAAKDKFASIINLLRQHDGPVILTARLELVTVMAGGKPTTDKTWKVRAEKNLPFEVDAVIQAREPRTWEITGLRSTRFQLEPGKTIPMPGFTVEGFLRRLGLDQEGATAPRAITLPRPDAPEQTPPLANADQKRDLAILIGQKLGPQAARNRHNVMSRRFQRHITSFDQLYSPEAEVAKRELSAMPDYRSPRDAALYEQLRAQLRGADLDGIDPALHAVADAHAAGLITEEDVQELAEFADDLTKMMIADAAGERDWPRYTADEEQPEAVGA